MSRITICINSLAILLQLLGVVHQSPLIVIGSCNCFDTKPFLLLTTQPPIEEDDESLEGPSPPLSAGSFVQELFQAQYR